MKRFTTLLALLILTISVSSPGFAQKRRDLEPAPAQFTKFFSANAVSDGRGAWLEWEMESEVNNSGFLVYRLEKGERPLTEIHFAASRAIKNAGFPWGGEKYNYFDESGEPGSQYVIDSFQTDGTVISSEIVTATPVSDISPFAGYSSDQLRSGREKASGIIETNRLIPHKELQNEIDSNQLTADLGTHRWVVSQPGVKFGIRSEGVYRVTRAQLQTAGFDVGSNSNLWRLYAEGVEQAIIVGGSGDYIEFYGSGIDTVESDTRAYYLIVGPSAGKRMGTRVSRRTNSTVLARSYNQTFFKTENINYIYNILNGPPENYWGRIVLASSAMSVPMQLSGIDFTQQSAVMTVRMQGFSNTPHTVSVNLNGNDLGSMTGNDRLPFSANFTIPVSMLIEGANSLTLRSTGGTSDNSMFDSVSIRFARRHLAVQNKLAFFTQNYREARLEGFTSANIRLFDITHAGNPIVVNNLNIQPNGTTYDVNLPSYRGRLYNAVEDSGLLQPASIAANNPSTLSNPSNAGTLIIVSHKNWMSEAGVWAEYRALQGIIVKVVDVEDIYDEFGYGVLSSQAVTNFLQYAKNNWQVPPGYVLLLGDATFDPRNYEGFGNYFVPTKMVQDSYIETGSDEGMADFNNDELAEVAVGRIPARNAQEVTNALNKVMSFEQPPMWSLNRGAIFAHDVSTDYDFLALSQSLRNELPPGIPATFISRTQPNAGTTLINEINMGRYIVNYSGHGTAGAWKSISFFGVNTSVPQLTNANNLSIFTMHTCLNGYFLHPTTVYISERLVHHTNGGAVATWSSTGETTAEVQHVMGVRFYNRLNSGTIPRIGDLIMDAKTFLNGGPDVRLTWILFGDPMLQVRPTP